MDLQALFKISHGVYLTGATDKNGHLIGSCIDSVMVVETNPQQVIISLNNTSYTMENVLKSNKLTLSVLADTTTDKVIELFGTHSSRNIDKWAHVAHTLFHNLPVYDKAVAYMYLTIEKTFQTNNHHVFLCRVTDGQKGSMAQPLTYAAYQARKENKA